MSPRVWLLLFIFSVVGSAEAMLWAYSHGQFHDVERGRSAPLRAANSPLNRSRHRPWNLALYVFGLVVSGLILAYTVSTILINALVIKP